jgi:glutathione-regulated potassium-efflux system ancillary protein KefG
MIKKRILVLFAHPASHKSRVNKKMIAEMNDIEGITFNNLYEEYPDFQIDIKKEQDLLLNHDIIIWHHPFYWYSAPAIIKEWIDLVLQHGFAYGRMGTALKNKQVLSVITTGGRREAYQADGFNQYTMCQFLVPFERTVTLCNMNYLPPFVVHGSHLLTEDEINSAARDYRKILILLRDDIFDQNDIMNCGYLNDLLVINKKS